MSAEPVGGPPSMTAEDLLALPDDGLRHELIDGELQTMSPAGVRHGIVAARVLMHVMTFVDTHRLGFVVAAETGFVLRRGPDSVRGPDVAFIPSADLADPRSATGYGETVPALAAEVVSPNDTASRVTRKALLWLGAGVRLVWIVDPELEAVTVYTPGGVARLLGAGDTLDGGDVLPGLALPLAALFEDLH